MDNISADLDLRPGQMVWLSREVLDWATSTEEMANRRTDWEGHYAPWEHASSILMDKASEQDRACAIFQLRRAVEFRDRALKSTYFLDSIPGIPTKKFPLILSELKIVLPIMRQKLVDIRNDVSHDFTKLPPDLYQCRELAEFTWYFLKSTDHLLSSPIQALCFDDEDESRLGSFRMAIQLKGWTMSLSGQFDHSLVKQIEGDKDVRVTIQNASPEGRYIFLNGHPYMHQDTMISFLQRYFATRY